MSDYAFDVFISYRRVYPFDVWLKEMFLADFEAELNSHLPEDVRIFWDAQIPVGGRWPDVLKNALQRSKCLVPIWSPQYFRSDWCMSEWKSFEKRGTGLVVPIRWTEEIVHFPDDARPVQMADFSRFAHAAPAFKATVGFVKMQRAIRAFARNVAAALAFAPEFTAGDPRFEPVEVAPTSPPKVRLQPLGAPLTSPSGAAP